MRMLDHLLWRLMLRIVIHRRSTRLWSYIEQRRILNHLLWRLRLILCYRISTIIRKRPWSYINKGRLFDILLGRLALLRKTLIILSSRQGSASSTASSAGRSFRKESLWQRLVLRCKTLIGVYTGHLRCSHRRRSLSSCLLKRLVWYCKISIVFYSGYLRCSIHEWNLPN